MAAPLVATVGVIGAGRVGASLGAALHAAPGFDVVAVAGESDSSRTRIATLLPHLEPSKPSAVARACEVLLLTVPDDMLGNVVTVLADSGALHPDQLLVHTSGRHGLGVLGPALALGARGLAFHPAMTFTGTVLDVPRLVGAAFGVTADDPQAVELARQLTAALGGVEVWIEEAKRELYHAGLAHGANHLVTLVSSAMELVAASGASDPARILRPLLEAALDNALSFGDAALTGPIARGDVATVQAHVAQISTHHPSELPLYRALAQATVGRAAADQRLQLPRAEQLRIALECAAEASKA